MKLLQFVDGYNNKKAVIITDKGAVGVVDCELVNGVLYVVKADKVVNASINKEVLWQREDTILASAQETKEAQEARKNGASCYSLYRSSGYKLTSEDVATISKEPKKYGYTEGDNLLEVGKVARIEYQRMTNNALEVVVDLTTNRVVPTTTTTINKEYGSIIEQ